MVENLLRSLEEFQKEIDALSQLSSRSGQTFSAIELQAQARAEEEQKRELAKKKQLEESVEGLKQLGSGVVGFSKAMTSGQSGMAKYASSLSSMVEGVGKASKILGLLGGPITLVAGAIATLVGAVLEQNDKILESYDQLAQIGVSAGMTATELDTLVAKSQGTLDYLPSFVAATKKLGANIMALGHSTAEGTKKFAEITSLSPELRNQFRNLGLSQEKVNELQADYISQYAIQDQLKNKDAAAIRAASLNWIKETAALTAITGLTREQQMSANDALKNDVAYQAMMMNTTDEQKASLKNMATMFENMSPGWGREITRKVLSGYTISGELETALSAAGFTAKDFDELRAASKKSPEEFTTQLQTIMKRANTVLTSAQMRDNLSQHEFADKVGINQKMMEAFSRIANSKPYDQVRMDQEKQATTGDSLLDLRNTVINAENKLKTVFQELIRLISGPVNSAFKWVADTVSSFIDAVRDSKIFRFVMGDKDETGKRYTTATNSTDASKKLDKLLELEKQATADLAAMSEQGTEGTLGMFGEGWSGHTPADIAAKQKELDEIKKNRALAESNLDKLKQMEADAAAEAEPPKPGAPGGPPAPPEPPKPSTPDQTKTAPAKPVVPKPAVTEEKKPQQTQATRATEQKPQPPVAAPVTINVHTGDTKPAPAKPAPATEDKKPVPAKPAPATDAQKPADKPVTPPKEKKVDNANQHANGGIASGPTSGYDAKLHGVEAVIPLPNNRSIPVTISVNAEFESILDTVRAQGEAMRATVLALNKTQQLDYDKLIDTLSSELEEHIGQTETTRSAPTTIEPEIDPSIVEKIDTLVQLFAALLDKVRDNKAAHEMILQEVKRA